MSSELASTVQSTHINRDPSPAHDLNPSTAASTRRPLHKHRRHRRGSDGAYADPSDDDDDDDDFDYDDDEGDDVDVPLSVLRPREHPGSQHKARGSFPPMPDLRFEQSYLHSIRSADSWWKVAWVTVRDQVRRFSLVYSSYLLHFLLPRTTPHPASFPGETRRSC